MTDQIMYNQHLGLGPQNPTDGPLPRPLPDLNHGPHFGYSVNPTPPPTSHTISNPITQSTPHPPFGIGIGHGPPPSDQPLITCASQPPQPRSLSCDTTMGQTTKSRHRPYNQDARPQAQSGRQRPTTPGPGSSARPGTPGFRPQSSRSITMPVANQVNVNVNTNARSNALDSRLVYDPTANRFYLQDGILYQQKPMGNGLPPTPTSAGIPSALPPQQSSAHYHPQQNTTPVTSRTPSRQRLVMCTQQQHHQSNVQNQPQRSTTPAVSCGPEPVGLVVHNQPQQIQQLQPIVYNRQQRCTTPVAYHAPNSAGIVSQNPQQQQQPQQQPVVYNQQPQRSTTPGPSYPPFTAGTTLHQSQQQALANNQPQQSTTPSASQASISAAPTSHYSQQQQLPTHYTQQTPTQQYTAQTMFTDPHFECRMKSLGLQTMLENLQQALNQINTEGHPDANRIMNHLLHENQQLRAALSAKNDPRLQQQDAPKDVHDNTAMAGMGALLLKNSVLTAANAQLQAQLMKESETNQAMCSRVIVLETSIANRSTVASTQTDASRIQQLTAQLAAETKQSEIKTNQVLAFQHKLTQQITETEKLRQMVAELGSEQRKRYLERIAQQQAPTEQVGRPTEGLPASTTEIGDLNTPTARWLAAAGNPTVEALVAQVNELQERLADYQQPWLKDGENSDRTRFEQLQAAYEEEKLEKERLCQMLSQAKDWKIRRELATSHRENKQETTKLQIHQLGETVIDMTADSSPADQIDPEPMTPPANPSDNQGDGDVPTDMDIDSDIDTEADAVTKQIYANDIQDLQLQVAVNLPSTAQEIIDEKKHEESTLATVSHIKIICSGSLDLMRWVEKLVEQEFAERPLAERQCHRGMMKLGMLMDEVKGSIGWLRGAGAGQDQCEKSDEKE